MSKRLSQNQQDLKIKQIYTQGTKLVYDFNENERGDRSSMKSTNKNFYWNLKPDPNHKYQIMSLGYKIFEVSKIQQPRITNCLHFLQSAAEFPITIFSKNVESKTKQNEIRSKRSQKDYWLQTKIYRSNVSLIQTEQEINKKHEYQINRFFNQFLIPKLQKFKNEYLSQSTMYQQDEDYDEIYVVQKFKKEILNEVNTQFAMLLNSNPCSS